jgi:hypothetical protein
LGQSTRNTARTKTDTNRLTSDGDPLLVVTATLNTTETSTTPAAHGNSITGSAHSETSTHTVTTLVQTDQNQSLTVAINETTNETRVTTSDSNAITGDFVTTDIVQNATTERTEQETNQTLTVTGRGLRQGSDSEFGIHT